MATEKRDARRTYNPNDEVGTTVIAAQDESAMLRSAESQATYTWAQARVLAFTEDGHEDPEVDEALEILLAEGKNDEQLIAELEALEVEPGPSHDDASFATAPNTSDAVTSDRSPVVLLLELAPSRGDAVGFVRLPNYLIHGEAVARWERLCHGLGWLIVVLLRYADRREHVISASAATLCREAGLGDARTLEKRLQLLCRGDAKAGLPPLLRKLPGTPARYAFREDGLQALANLAHRSLAARDAKRAAVRRARSEGGQRGMAARWDTQRA